MRGATRRPACGHLQHLYFNPRAPCGARLKGCEAPAAGWVFQSTRPMRGATPRSLRGRYAGDISIHAPHAGRDAHQDRRLPLCHHFNPRAPCGARRTSLHRRACPRYFNPRAPCGARRGRQRNVFPAVQHFNPRAPCGARLNAATQAGDYYATFQSTRPMRGATRRHDRAQQALHISIHAPHAGRDSKSIQNYFTHFCDKRQFLDNFTQNTAFQSVLPLADRQKLLYLRCEPLRKFLRAFASHYKIIGSSGR